MVGIALIRGTPVLFWLAAGASMLLLWIAPEYARFRQWSDYWMCIAAIGCCFAILVFPFYIVGWRSRAVAGLMQSFTFPNVAARFTNIYLSDWEVTLTWVAWFIAYTTVFTLVTHAPTCVLDHVRRRRDARLQGCCRTCGYSLRGLDRPRCPECGTSFERNDGGDCSPSAESRSVR